MVTPIIMVMATAMVEIQNRKLENYFLYEKTTQLGWSFFLPF